jgi:hypothetical protein
MLKYSIVNNITKSIVLITNDQTVFHAWLASKQSRLDHIFGVMLACDNPLDIDIEALTKLQASQAAYQMIRDLDTRKRVNLERGILSCSALLFDVIIETVIKPKQ